MSVDPTSTTLIFNKNKKISSLATAIIIVIMSLSSLQLDSRHSSIFTAEPAFAQVSGEALLYEDEQIPAIPSSSSSMMDFGLLMDSFAGSVFNATSIFGGIGTSMVNGIEVSGIGLDKGQNRLYVILSDTAAPQVRIGNNVTSSDTINTTSSTVNSTSVSIIAMRIPINMADILSLAAASSSSNDDIFSNTLRNTSENEFDAFPSNRINPFSLLSNLQIGSSTLIDPDWSVPHTVTMDLIGSGVTNQEQQQQQQQPLTSDNEGMANLLLVSVIPYTGLGNGSLGSTP